MATIVLDPGHGGLEKIGGSSPNNAVGPTGLLEKTVTLDIALRAKPMIEALGHKVTLTRSKDVNLGLANRAGYAKARKAPVFVSIHLNGFNHKAQGTETWLHSAHSAQSERLAQCVQTAMLGATGLKDRGVQAKQLGVLDPESHWSGTACCLVEISFMDIAAEEARLKTTGYRDSLAAAICFGVKSYLAAGQAEAVEESAGFEDGFAVTAAEAVAPSKARKLAKAASRAKPNAGGRGGKGATEQDVNDRNEFAIVGIGKPFRPGRKRTAESVDADSSEFGKYVATLGLRHVTADSLLYLGGSNAGSGPCAGKNEPPPKALWPNIGRTAQMLDEISERLGGKCLIHSAYRNAAYNSCVGGEKNSYHSRFFAIDFSFTKGKAADWHKVACAVRDSNKKFLGGIGKYATFVHIDTRGYRADW